MEYPRSCPFQQYQFERYFVLALTLLGNLTHNLSYDVKMLFQRNLRFLTASTGKVKLRQDNLIPMINEAANACTTKQIFMIIYKIQKLHYRNMVTFDFNDNCFKAILPKTFQSFPLYSKVESIQTHRKPVFVEDKEMQVRNITTHDDAEDINKPMTTLLPKSDPAKTTKKLVSEEQTKPATVPKELKLLPQFMWTKDKVALYGHIHIDKNVANIS